MSKKRQIEVFSAGCPACDEAIQIVRATACTSCEVHILDMHQPDVAAKARSYGITKVPAVVVDGKLADCCQTGQVDAETLRQLGVGTPPQN